MSDVAVFDDLRSIDFASTSGSYALVGTSFDHVVRIINFDNGMDGDLLVSFNGVDDHLFMPANSLKVFDLTTNRADNNASWSLPIGTTIYVKQSSAPTSGSFYVACVYQRGR